MLFSLSPTGEGAKGVPPPSLRDWLQKACAEYKETIATGKKCYSRFCIDFLRRNQKIYCYPLPSPQMEADICVQWGQLTDLFITREDLVHRYFRESSPDYGKIDEMISHFMKGTGKQTKSRYRRLTPAWRVHPCIGEEEWEYMAAMVNSTGIFDTNISPREMESLLTGTLKHPVKARENNRVCFFLGQLSLKGILTFRWQHLLGQEGMILSAKDSRPLNRKKLCDSWSEVRRELGGCYEKIQKFVQQLAEIIVGKS